MKPVFTLIITAITSIVACGQEKQDTTSSSSKIIEVKNPQIPDTTIPIIDDDEMQPQFKGGIEAFCKYIEKSLKYPEVAQLIGINGKLKMQFIVDKDGSIVEATPLSCIGAGCEAEAVRVLTNSPKWKPGIQKGKLVRVQYTIPIDFTTRKAMVSMKELRKSDYGFFFLIKDKEYNIDQAEEVLGKEFLSNSILIAEEQFDDQHKVAGKKATYLLKIEG